MQEKRLSARGIAALTKPGRHADGGGLYLVISNRDGFTRRSSLYLFTWQGKLKAMGLGPLAEARALRDNWRRVLRSGRNPIEARREGKIDARHEQISSSFLHFRCPGGTRDLLYLVRGT
jgi:hypothetical protein